MWREAPICINIHREGGRTGRKLCDGDDGMKRASRGAWASSLIEATLHVFRLP
jgi:hypothetical protein